MPEESPLRIVMFVENNSYPLDIRVRNEAETLAAAGHRVVVFAPRATGQPWQEEISNVRVRRFRPPPEGKGLLGYLAEFGYATLLCVSLVMREWLFSGMDVLHVHNPPDTLFVAGLLPRIFGKKLVYDHHDLAPELYLAKYESDPNVIYRVLMFLEKLSCQFADRVITVNESYRQSDIQRNGVKPEHIEVVRNGPPLDRIKPVEFDPDIRSRASTLFGYLGSISQQDGVDHLIRALYHLQNDFNHDDWYAVIIGPADDPKILTDLSKQLGLGDKIWFAGYQPPPCWQRILASVDICVVPDPANPLNTKSTMVKTMDYMALGKPIVAYDMAENRVSAGESALYAKPNEPVDMARQFVALIESPEKREQLGQLGRQRISQSLAWEYSAKRLISFYQTFY
jgi:glycosyltransferase involved in cell wall biosynthesis